MTSFERTGWRDEELSLRHRFWGFNCPAADLDFLMVEYNLGLPVALVEYKYHKAESPDLQHPTYRALTDLAGGYRNRGLPFIVVFYWKEPWAFRVHPVNDLARKVYTPASTLTEKRFVESLYYLRRQKIEQTVLAQLDDTPILSRRPDGDSLKEHGTFAKNSAERMT